MSGVEAHLQDGTILQFPEGTADDVVQATVKRHLTDAAGGVPPDVPDWLKPSFQPSRMGEAKAIADPIIKGLSTVPGFFGDLQGVRDSAVDYLTRKAIGAVTGREPPSSLPMVQPDQFPTSADIRAPLRDAGLVDQPAAQPKTFAGEVGQKATQGAASMAPFGPFGMALGATGGAAGAVGGHFFGPAGEMAGNLIGPLGVMGVRRAATTAPSRVLADAVSNLTPEQATAATGIFDAAQKAGTPVTWAEAIAQASGGNKRLTDIQRVVEQSRGGAPGMESVIGPRTENNRTAFSRLMDEKFGPAPDVPGGIGPRVQKAAEGVLQNERNITNDLSRPAYDRSSNDPANELSTRAFQDLQQTAGVPEAIAAVRANPIRYGDLRGLPDNSIKVLDAAKKYADEVVKSAQTEGHAFSIQNAGKLGDAITGAIDAEFPSYASARNIQSIRMRHVEEPLAQSPTGDLSRIGGETGETKFAAARGILFPKNPETLTPQAVTKTISEVRMRDPQAAQDLVYQFLDSHFNKLSRDLSGGAQPFGGAKFRADLMGNTQQAANLEAAIRALPNGEQKWRAFSNLMDVFAAQGKRQVAGSQTEFNRQIAQELGAGGSQVITKPIGYLQNVWQQLLYGRNTAKIADLLNDPNAIGKLRQLSMYNRSSDKAALIAAQALGFDGSRPALPAPETAR